jgi:hypothetical protein
MKLNNEQSSNSYRESIRFEAAHAGYPRRPGQTAPSMLPLFFRPCLHKSPPRIKPTTHQRGDSPLSCLGLRSQLHQLKRKLLRAALKETSNSQLYTKLCQAAQTAAELAWATGEPLLVFPVLFDELAGRFRRRAQK